MTQLRRITIYADDVDAAPSEDVVWVRAWLERWKAKVRVADYSSGGWEHLWDVEGPEAAIAEVPERLHCCSEWANPEIFGEKMPNKAPEPTPGAVMPRATEGDSK